MSRIALIIVFAAFLISCGVTKTCTDAGCFEQALQNCEKGVSFVDKTEVNGFLLTKLERVSTIVGSEGSLCKARMDAKQK